MTPQHARQVLAQLAVFIRVGVAEHERRPSGWGRQVPLPAVLDLADLFEAAATPDDTDGPRPPFPHGGTAAAQHEVMPALLTYDEAAQSCRLSTRTLQRASTSGALRVVRVGGATRIDPADLADWLEARKSA